DPNVVLAVDVPRTGMTNHVAITRFGELRALPERRRQRIESEGGVEALAVAHHPALIDSMGAQQRRPVDARRRCGWRDPDVNAAPLLRPDVAEEMRRDHGVGRTERRIPLRERGA